MRHATLPRRLRTSVYLCPPSRGRTAMSYQSMTLCASHSPGFARDDEEQFGDEFRQGLRRAKGMVEEFAPTLVVFFGSDHRRAFTDTIPSVSVVLGAEGMGDLLSPTGPVRRTPRDRGGAGRPPARLRLRRRRDPARRPRPRLRPDRGRPAGRDRRRAADPDLHQLRHRAARAAQRAAAARRGGRRLLPWPRRAGPLHRLRRAVAQPADAGDDPRRRLRGGARARSAPRTARRPRT